MKMILAILTSIISTAIFAGDQCEESKILAQVKFEAVKKSVMERNHFAFNEEYDHKGDTQRNRDKTNLAEVNKAFRDHFNMGRNPLVHYLRNRQRELLGTNPDLLFQESEFRVSFKYRFDSALWNFSARSGYYSSSHPRYDATVTSDLGADRIWTCVTGNHKLDASLCYSVKYTDFQKIKTEDLTPIPYIRKQTSNGVVVTAVHDGIDFEKTPTVEAYIKEESDEYCTQKVLTEMRDNLPKEESEDSKIIKKQNSNSRKK